MTLGAQFRASFLQFLIEWIIKCFIVNPRFRSADAGASAGCRHSRFVMDFVFVLYHVDIGCGWYRHRCDAIDANEIPCFRIRAPCFRCRALVGSIAVVDTAIGVMRLPKWFVQIFVFVEMFARRSIAIVVRQRCRMHATVDRHIGASFEWAQLTAGTGMRMGAGMRYRMHHCLFVPSIEFHLFEDYLVGCIVFAWRLLCRSSWSRRSLCHAHVDFVLGKYDLFVAVGVRRVCRWWRQAQVSLVRCSDMIRIVFATFGLEAFLQIQFGTRVIVVCVMVIGKDHGIAGTRLECMYGRVLRTGCDFTTIWCTIYLLDVAVAIAAALHHLSWLRCGIGEWQFSQDLWMRMVNRYMVWVWLLFEYHAIIIMIMHWPFSEWQICSIWNVTFAQHFFVRRMSWAIIMAFFYCYWIGVNLEFSITRTYKHKRSLRLIHSLI